MTHTPGPWAVGGEEDNALWVSGPDASANVVCDLLPREFVKYVSPCWHEEDRANARLIAAAPSMYDALNQAPVLRLDESHSQFFERYSAWYRFDRRAAIAQAEERS